MKYLFRSANIFEDTREKHKWLAISLILSLCCILIEYLMNPYSVKLILNHLPVSVTDEEKTMISQNLHRELLTRLAFLFVRLPLGWMTFAFFLYYICISLKPTKRIRFVQMFSLEVHGEIYLVLGKIFMLIATMTGGVNSVHRIAVPFSITSFIRLDDYSLFTFCNNFNIFGLFYLLFLMSGVSAIYGFGRLKSLIVVFLVWLSCLMINISVITVMVRRFELIL